VSEARQHTQLSDAAPGDTKEYDVAANIRSYCIGLILAALLTVASFWALHTHLIWAPGIGIALGVLAVAQMGVHLVFFLHITTGPDNTNNVLALAFGVLIVSLLVIGSLWIMANLDHHHMPANQTMGRLNKVERGPCAITIC
jgi:cytochrome o ubiquinol oxidase operon protein cyoD